MNLKAHPSEDALEEYSFGRIGPETVVAKHILGCVVCQDALDGLHECTAFMRAAITIEPTHREPRHAKILLIEDNQSDVFFVKKALRELGISFDLDHCSEGEQALEYLASPPEIPDLILLDLTLPRISGFEVLRAIRNHSELSHLPVAVLAPPEIPPERLQAHRQLADAFISKPSTYPEFLERLGNSVWPILAAA
jgi:CheY-like chemotaxis protein